MGTASRQAPLAAGLALLAAAGVVAWLLVRPADAPESEPPSERDRVAEVPPTEAGPPPEPRGPVLAGRGRRVILAGSARERPGPPPREAGGERPPTPEAGPSRPPDLPPLSPDDPGRVRVRLVPPDGGVLPPTAEVVRGALATGMEWEGTVWIRDGALVVEGVPEGEQQIVAEVGEWAPVVLSVRARRGLETDVGEARLDVGHAVRGEVVDAEGRPVRGALVRGAGRRRDAWTDDRGAFALDRLPAGPVDVEAEAEGFLSMEVEVVAGRDATVRIVLERAARIEGILVTDAGTPAGFVRLVLVDVGDPFRGTLEPFAFRTDEDGTFEIEAVPGRYRVETGQAPLGVVLGAPEVEGGRSYRLSLRLPKER